MKNPFGDDTHTQQLFMTYIKKLSIPSVEQLVNEENATLLFKAITRDFLDYTLDLDDFSLMCEKLWTLLQDKQERSLSLLAGNCQLAADLEWYIRNNPVKAGEMLAEVISYYKKLL